MKTRLDLRYRQMSVKPSIPLTVAISLANRSPMLSVVVRCLFLPRQSQSRATVIIAYRKAVEIQNAKGYVSGPKRIGIFDASYLYPVFLKLGIITRDPVYEQVDLLN